MSLWPESAKCPYRRVPLMHRAASSRALRTRQFERLLRLRSVCASVLMLMRLPTLHLILRRLPCLGHPSAWCTPVALEPRSPSPTLFPCGALTVTSLLRRQIPTRVQRVAPATIRRLHARLQVGSSASRPMALHRGAFPRIAHGDLVAGRNAVRC